MQNLVSVQLKLYRGTFQGRFFFPLNFMSARILSFIPVMTNALFKVHLSFFLFVLKDGLGN